MKQNGVEVKAPGGPGDGGADVKPEPPADKYKIYGRLSEILAVLWLPGCLFVYGLTTLPQGVKVAACAALIALSLLAAVAAVRYALMSGEEQRRREAEEEELAEVERERAAGIEYKVTAARLSTLEQVKVPSDVRAALAKLSGEGPLKADDLLRKLALDPSTDLGWERTNEFKEKILKYTKLDEKADKKTGEKTDAGLRPGADAGAAQTVAQVRTG